MLGLVGFIRCLFVYCYTSSLTFLEFWDFMAEALNTCPFCGQSFKQLSQHLYRCSERCNRDYHQYLKTSKTGKVCPGCHKFFKRYDLHLKNNKSCHLFSADKSSSIIQPQQPPHSGPMENAQPAPPSSNTDNPTSISDLPFSSKPLLRLPPKKDLNSWNEADAFMESVVSPSVLSLTSVDEMNTILIGHIYEYFSSKHGTLPQPSQKRTNHHRPHLQSSLSKIRREKNQLKKKYRTAIRSDSISKEALTAMSKSFHELVRSHSKLRKELLKRNKMSDAKCAIKQCTRNFWKFADKLFSDDDIRHVQPSFTKEQAYQFFSNTYKSSAIEEVCQPSWMTDVPTPNVPFFHGTITYDELVSTLKKCRSGSSPSPLDAIPYTILKRCPSLQPALLHLYNTCLMKSQVPAQWKAAVIKLIPKPKATSCPSDPKNFRPIALTSCIGKVFTSIIKRRWEDHMICNSFLDTNIQKAFQSRIAGCEEHQLKLSSIIRDANKHQRSLTIAWLDLANAYGSVNHQLIQFALSHYHAPPELIALTSNLYHNQQAIITCQNWQTNPVSLQVGVFQGDPFSVAIFNTVINLLLDHIKHVCPDTGYRFSSSDRQLSTLQYADDTCYTARNPKKCQEMLNATDVWLKWAQMEPKVPKCRTLSLQSRHPQHNRFSNPHLTLGTEEIPFLGDETIPFLGMPVTKLMLTAGHRESISKDLVDLLERVDTSPVTTKQKVKLYKDGICPRLAWGFRVLELPISWIERELESKATKFLKKWMSIPKGGNTKLLYLPKEDGGLALPALSTFYKQQQASRHILFSTSKDECVRYLETQHSSNLSTGSFTPSSVVHQAICQHPSHTKSQLKSLVKRTISEADASTRKSHLLNLPVQGRMFQQDVDYSYWADAVSSLPDRELKFAYNAAIDTLPTNANLAMWYKGQVSAQCKLCRFPSQSLKHVLNKCDEALRQHRFDPRHDAVLSVIHAFLVKHTTDLTILADLPGVNYAFPSHIAATNERPDIVLWNDKSHTITMIELTIPFEDNFVDAHHRKSNRYHDLLQLCIKNNYHAQLYTIQVGSRGVIDLASLSCLADLCKPKQKLWHNLLVDLSRAAITGSFVIWCSRNRV